MTRFSLINLTLLLSIALILAGAGLISCRMLGAENQVGQPENKEEIHADSESPKKETTPEEQSFVQPTPTPMTTPIEPSPTPTQTPIMEIPSGRSPDIIRVKFLAGTDVNPPEDALPTNLTDQVDSIRPLIGSLSDEELSRIGADVLKLWFEITLKPSTDAIQFIADLRNLTNVESAHFAPLPAPPPG